MKHRGHDRREKVAEPEAILNEAQKNAAEQMLRDLGAGPETDPPEEAASEKAADEEAAAAEQAAADVETAAAEQAAADVETAAAEQRAADEEAAAAEQGTPDEEAVVAEGAAGEAAAAAEQSAAGDEAATAEQGTPDEEAVAESDAANTGVAVKKEAAEVKRPWWKRFSSGETTKSSAGSNGVHRMVFVGISVILELVMIGFIVLRFNENAEWIAMLTRVAALFLVLKIYSQNKTASMKMPWVLLIMAVPVLGLALYLMIGMSGSTKKMALRYAQVDTILFPHMSPNTEELEELRRRDMDEANLATYLKRYSGYPVYGNTDAKYYGNMSEVFEDMKTALENAEKFIFLEYFAIEDATVWSMIQGILEKKVKEGVEVRVFYDDVGSIGFIDMTFAKKLEAVGIRCRVFNPVAPGLNLFLNNRDHRKILVVDGKIGFTGGFNLADEYFGLTEPYGKWKDSGVRLEGDAVRSLTVIFLEMWNAVRNDDVDDRSPEAYLPKTGYVSEEKGALLQPFADSPMDNEPVGENVYISMVENARSYVWFATPYLILTDEMIHALGLAAKKGLDVRIITPGIPDKKTVYGVTRSYYYSLIRNGVRIYEYTPGFCHSKLCISDDRIAVCGTINLDYRSLYHSFENAVVFYGGKVIGEMKEDYLDMLRVSEDVTDKYSGGRRASLRFRQLVLRVLAPLM